MFVVTGNTFNTGGNWMGGEAIIRLQAGPTWTGLPTDYWAPTNWLSLDNSDTDLGGVSGTVIDVPGATPSQLVLALGKDRNAYLLNRNNLGGITAPVAQASVSGTTLRGTSAVTYHTSQGTYFAFHDDGNAVTAYKITATNPPGIVSAWSMGQGGRGSPWVTTTDGTNNAIVWVAGVAGDQRLHGYNADTGAVVYAGGGSNELMTGTRQWNTGIVARGRIYFGADNKIYAFRLPTGTPTPTPTATATLLLPPLQRQPQLPPQLRHLLPLQARHRQLRLLLLRRQPRGRSPSLRVATKCKDDTQWTSRGAARLGSNVDIYRNGVVVATTRKRRVLHRLPGGRGHATFTYKVCQAGTQTCSNQVTVTF